MPSEDKNHGLGLILIDYGIFVNTKISMESPAPQPSIIMLKTKTIEKC